MTQITLDENGFRALRNLHQEDFKTYMEDMKSVAETNTPQGLTGDLARNWETSYAIDGDKITGRISNGTHYAIYQEIGTEPFKAKLIEVDLGPRTRQRIAKETKLRIGRRGGVLVPVWWDWGERVMKPSCPGDTFHKQPWKDPVENYVNSWNIWFKIMRKGITPKRMLHKSAEIMKKKSSLYPYADRIGARIEVGI